MLVELKSIGLRYVDQKRKEAWVFAGLLTTTRRLCSSTFGSSSRIKSLYGISGSIPPFSRTRTSGLRPSRLFVPGRGRKFSTSERSTAHSLNGGLVMECRLLSGSIIGIPKDHFSNSSLIEIYIVLVSPEMPQFRKSYLSSGSLLTFCNLLTLGQTLSLPSMRRGQIN